MEKRTGARIVVGVDGSPSSKAALAWALDEARLRQVPVEAVYAWEFPAFALTHFGGEAVPVFAPDDIEKRADAVLFNTVKEVMGGNGDVDVTATLVKGHPAEALLDIAQGADLLVVGSRGRGGFTGMLLGSVSSHVVHHARCPVVVISA